MYSINAASRTSKGFNSEGTDVKQALPQQFIIQCLFIFRNLIKTSDIKG